MVGAGLLPWGDVREWGGGVAAWVGASCDKASLISEFGELWGDE